MRILIIFISILVTSCTTGQKSRNLDYSIKHIQSFVGQNIPGGIAGISVNRREFKSKYFKPEIYFSKLKDKKVYRTTLYVTVLGGYRPYKLSVKTVTQVRVHGGKPKTEIFSDSDLIPGVWKTVKVPGLDRFLLMWLVDNITQAPRHNNFIDDFHPF